MSMVNIENGRWENAKFKKTILNNVTCQLRFPSMLEIESGNIVDFQKKIRDVFPEEATRMEPDMLPDNVVRPSFSMSAPHRVHEFYTSDKKTTVCLSKTFVALTSYEYNGWNDFKRIYSEIYSALTGTYEIPYFTRIGIRYVNVITRSQLGLPIGTRWNELIDSSFLGMMGTDDGNKVDSINSVTVISCSENIKMRIQSGTYLTMENKEEDSFVLDVDTFTTGNTSCNNTEDVVEELHKQPCGLLEHVVKDNLYKAMEPELI